MSAILNVSFPDETNLSAQEIEQLLETHRERQKTSVLRLKYELDKRLYFLFKRGELVNVYLAAPEQRESFSFENSLSWVRSAGEAYVKSVPLSNRGLRIIKLLLQARQPVIEKSLARSEIAEQLTKLESERKTALAHFEWENAEGAVLFNAQGAHYLFFMSPDLLLDEEGGGNALCEWNEPRCAMRVFESDLEIEAWQEYYLRRAFKHICETSLTRFETLTGQALVNSLARLFNAAAQRQNVEVSLARNKVSDSEVFPSPRQALYSYRSLLAEIFEHFATVIGPRLYTATLREAALTLPQHELETIRKLELLPRGYLE